MFDRFSETAIKAIVIAQDEATKLGHQFVGTEMILLGLLHTEDSVAAAALRSQGVTFKDAQAEVERTIGRGSGFGMLSYHLTPRAKTLVMKLAEQAKNTNEIIASQQLLLGLLEREQIDSENPSIAIKVMRNLGVDLNALQNEVLKLQRTVTDSRVLTVDLPLPEKDIVDRFSNDTIKAILWSQRKALECGEITVEFKHIILGLIHADATVARMLGDAGYRINEPLKGEFMGPSAVDPLLAKLPFSPQARSIFESAGDLATQFGHREIVPQHILFAFLAKPESTRLEILGELPIDYDSLQKLLQTALLRNDRPSDSQDPSSRTALDVGFNRYTEKAIKVILRAQEESRRLGHNYVGTEQILLGLISEGTGIAAKTLKTKKISLKETRNAVEKIIGRGNGFVSVQIPFTTRAKDLFEGAWMEARAFGHDYVGTEHLLLSLVHLQESVGLRVLQGFGISPAEIQECVRTMLLITQEQHYIQESPLAGAYQPTDDAAALRRKIARWESEADLCRRVEKEAIRQAEICRRALSEMTSEDSNDSISDES